MISWSIDIILDTAFSYKSIYALPLFPFNCRIVEFSVDTVVEVSPVLLDLLVLEDFVVLDPSVVEDDVELLVVLFAPLL